MLTKFGQLIDWWRCRRSCGVDRDEAGHPIAVWYCDRPACGGAVWLNAHQVS